LSVQEHRVAKKLLSLLVSGALLVVTYFLMGQTDAKAEMLRKLADLKWIWVIAAVLAGFANNVIAAFRFRLVIRSLSGTTPSMWTVFKINAAALFLGYWTPISIAGDAGRMFRLRRGIAQTYRHAFLIVLWDRLIALAALVFCMLPFIPVYIRRVADYAQMSIAVVVAALFVSFALVAAVIVSRHVWSRYFSAPSAFWDRRDLIAHLLIGLLYVGTFCLVTLCAAASLGLTVSWIELLVAAPILFLAQNVPITFGGLGSRELAFLIMLGPVIGNSGAVAISLVVGLGFLVAALPGGLVLNELAEPHGVTEP
jgi:glycosyltransferase 2 family protein